MRKVALLLLVAVIASVQSQERGVGYTIGGRWVKPQNISRNFFQAAYHCKLMGMELFAPRNEREVREAHEIMNLTLNKESMWIGASAYVKKHHFKHQYSVPSTFWSKDKEGLYDIFYMRKDRSPPQIWYDDMGSFEFPFICIDIDD